MLHKLQKEGGIHYHGQKEEGACYREREANSGCRSHQRVISVVPLSDSALLLLFIFVLISFGQSLTMQLKLALDS